MTVTLSMFDNIAAGSIPPNPQACAGYVDGSWPDFLQMVNRFPALAKVGRVVSIATNPNDTARILDIEPGNPGSASGAPAWIKRMIAHGIYRPGVYADGSTMPSVISALNKSGLKRSDYVLWLADWNGVADVPTGYDAHQYTDKAGPNDESICLWSFFPPPPTPPASGVAKCELEFDLATGQWTLKALPASGLVWQPTARWASLEIQLGVGGKSAGQWRTQALPWNAGPLGS